MKLALRILGEFLLWCGVVSLFLIGAGSLFIRIYLSSHNGWAVFFVAFGLLAASLLVARFDKREQGCRLANNLGLLGFFLIGAVLAPDWRYLTRGFKWITVLFIVVPIGFAGRYLALNGLSFRRLFPK